MEMEEEEILLPKCDFQVNVVESKAFCIERPIHWNNVDLIWFPIPNFE